MRNTATGPAWTEQAFATPTLAPIRLLHRSGDSYVTFHTKSPFRNLDAILVGHLRSQWACHAEELDEDALFSVNGYWSWDLNKPMPVPITSGAAVRKRGHLRYLNAAYCDLDCYRVGLDRNDALAQVLRLVETAQIPPPSLVLLGHGLWLFWVVRESRTISPPAALPSNIRLYRSIQRAIVSRLAHLGADPAGTDEARLTRVPGSVHSGTGRRIAALLPVDENAHSFSFTLSELATLFQVEHPVSSDHRPTRRLVRSGESRAETTRNHRGWSAVNAHRVRQFEALWSIRGTFKEGCRNHAVLIYSRLLAFAGQRAAVIRDSVVRLADSCDPPLPRTEAMQTMKQGMKPRKKSIAGATISRLLAIQASEAMRLWRTFGRRAWKAVDQSATLSRHYDPMARLSAIRELVQECGWIPVRLMAARLKNLGLTVSASQVHRDYRTIRSIDERQHGQHTYSVPQCPK